MSKKHPKNGPTLAKGKNGPTLAKGKRKNARRRTPLEDAPRVDPSKPEPPVSRRALGFLAEWIGKLPKVARKWTSGRS